MSTLAEQLASVQAAIADIEANGQDVTFADGRRYTKADLKILYAREASLKSQVNQAANSIFSRSLAGRPYRG